MLNYIQVDASIDADGLGIMANFDCTDEHSPTNELCHRWWFDPSGEAEYDRTMSVTCVGNIRFHLHVTSHYFA